MRFIHIGAAVLAGISGLGAHCPAWAQAGDWKWYRSERFGYRLLFPADLLSPRGESQNGEGVEFISGDGKTKLKVLAVENSDQVTPEEYRAGIIREFPQYGMIHYGPMGQSWFVLSGMHGLSIYYQKIMFACGGRLINAFALTYPEEQKQAYDSIVTTIEKNFHTPSGPACFAATRE